MSNVETKNLTGVIGFVDVGTTGADGLETRKSIEFKTDDGIVTLNNVSYSSYVARAIEPGTKVTIAYYVRNDISVFGTLKDNAMIAAVYDHGKNRVFAIPMDGYSKAKLMLVKWWISRALNPFVWLILIIAFCTFVLPGVFLSVALYREWQLWSTIPHEDEMNAAINNLKKFVSSTA